LGRRISIQRNIKGGALLDRERIKRAKREGQIQSSIVKKRFGYLRKEARGGEGKPGRKALTRARGKKDKENWFMHAQKAIFFKQGKREENRLGGIFGRQGVGKRILREKGVGEDGGFVDRKRVRSN